MSNWGREFTEEDAKNEVAEGIHTVIITEVVERTTKKGGKGVSITFQVAKGDKKGSYASDWINTVNANPVAETIGAQALDALAKAIGLSGLTALNKTPMESLVNKVLDVELEKKEDQQYGDKSVIKKYLKPVDNTPSSETLAGDSVPF